VREHIKATRLEAVNQFIVSIRRELAYVRSRVQSDVMTFASGVLESKYTWHDIGVPCAGVNTTVELWLSIAKRKSYTADAQAEIIQADLEELERGLTGIRHQIDEMDRINREGEQVSDKLCAIFK
jgi:hypothetical protein